MFNGSLVALITPFKNGAVDEKGFEKFVAWQIKEGTDGLVPCGTTGESPTLSYVEHKRVIDICIATARGTGVPVIALFGPGNPVKWGPWPHGFTRLENPWRRLGSQRVNNVTLLQSPEMCVPCLHEGCERHTGSYSDCLQQLPVTRVIAALDAALAN